MSTATLSLENRPQTGGPDRALSWEPSREASRKILGGFAAGAGVIGLVGFSVSFASVMDAAWPYLGWACWALPVLVDLGIFTLTGIALFLELHKIRSRWIRLVPTALAAYTIYLNTATQTAWFGKAVHAAGPALWIVVVEIGAFTVRRLVGLTSESAMDKVRGIRWILAPLSTFRLWRRMRLWEITSYRTAIGREHALTASRALLRQWYGRAWRSKAPRGERLAVALQASSPRPVADVLSEASAGIVAAAAAAQKPSIPSAPESAPQVHSASGSKVHRTAARRDRQRTRQTDLIKRAREVNAQVIKETGAPVSARRLAREMSIGQDRARVLVRELSAPVRLVSSAPDDDGPQVPAVA